MPEQQLDAPYIGSLLEQMHREGVPQRMWGDGFADTGGSIGFSARQLHSVASDVPTWDVSWEEPRLGLLQAPPLAQNLQQLGRGRE